MNGRTLLKLVMPLTIIVLWEALSISIHNQFILPDIQSVLMVLLSPGTDIMGSGSLIENALMSLQRVCPWDFLSQPVWQCHLECPWVGGSRLKKHSMAWFQP